MIVLGIDFGSKRVGLAISDAEGAFAFPMSPLERRGMERDLEALCKQIAERAVERIVVGLPLRMSGATGPEAQAAKNFAAKLADASGLPVDTIDERLTTAEAERALRATGISPAKRRKAVDSIAATIILRTYLAQRQSAAERETSDS